MPNLAKFGGGSSRAFGFRGRTLKLFTQTFTTSQNFTIPNGVTRLQTFSGKAENGYPGGSTGDFIEIIRAEYQYGAGTFAGQTGYAPTWGYMDDLGGSQVAAANALPANYYGEGTPTYNLYIFRVDAAGNYADSNGSSFATYNFTGHTNSNYVSQVVPSGAPRNEVMGPNNFRGTNGTAGYAWVYYLYPGYIGTSGSAFGINLPGGQYTTASTINQSNVVVVPNQSYYLNIPSGGFVTITYLA